MREILFNTYFILYYVACIFFLVYWYLEHRKRFFYLSMITFLIPLLGLYLALTIMFIEGKRHRKKEESRFDSFEIEDVLKSTATELEIGRYHKMMEKPVSYDDVRVMSAGIDPSMAVTIQADILNRLTEAKKNYEEKKGIESSAEYVKMLHEYINCGLFEEKACEINFNLSESILSKMISEDMVSSDIYEQKIRNLITKKDFKSAMKMIAALQVFDPYNEHIIYFKMAVYSYEDSDRFTAYINELYNDPGTINSNYYGLVMFFAT